MLFPAPPAYTKKINSIKAVPAQKVCLGCYFELTYPGQPLSRHKKWSWPDKDKRSALISILMHVWKLNSNSLLLPSKKKQYSEFCMLFFLTKRKIALITTPVSLHVQSMACWRRNKFRTRTLFLSHITLYNFVGGFILTFLLVPQDTISCSFDCSKPGQAKLCQP